MQVKLYHNPRCSKSRETLKLLTEHGIHPEIVLYLENPPDDSTLQQILDKLGFKDARQLMRTKESLYRELGLSNPQLSQAALRQAMSHHPKLIERPIVITADNAKLGRPPEQVLTLFTN